MAAKHDLWLYNDIPSWYDICFIPEFKYKVEDAGEVQDAAQDKGDYCGDGVSCGTNTMWKTVWFYNGICMTVMGCNYILLALGSFFFWPRLIGTYLNCCFGCGALIGAFLGIFEATSPMGAYCGYNESANTMTGDDTFDEGGMTYQTDQVMMLLFGIIQLLLGLAQCSCCWMPLCCTPVKDKEYEKEKEKKKDKEQENEKNKKKTKKKKKKKKKTKNKKEKKKEEKEQKKQMEASQQQMMMAPQAPVMMPGQMPAGQVQATGMPMQMQQQQPQMMMNQYG